MVYYKCPNCSALHFIPDDKKKAVVICGICLSKMKKQTKKEKFK